jgi:hypothetical protein
MRKLIGTSLAVLGIVAAPGVARAQGVGHNMGNQPTEGVRFGVGAGLILPMGNYSTGDGVGFHALGLVQMPLPNSPVHLRADLMFAQTSHKSPASGSTRLIGGTVDALYHFGDRAGSLRPYVLGGLGYYNAHESVSGTSSSNIAFDLGGGVLFGLGATMHGFAELRYISVQTSGGATAFIPITVGLMFTGN